jgi:hypothetical protein
VRWKDIQKKKNGFFSCFTVPGLPEVLYALKSKFKGYCTLWAPYVLVVLQLAIKVRSPDPCYHKSEVFWNHSAHGPRVFQLSTTLLSIFFFAVLGFELRPYTWSHSTSPFMWRAFFRQCPMNYLPHQQIRLAGING